MRFRLIFGAALAASMLPLPAAAQQWLSDRRYQEGIGLRVGDLELHPSLSGEVGYDSNYFERADSEQPVSAIRSRITGALSLSTLGPQRRGANAGAPPSLAMRSSLFVAYNHLFFSDSTKAGTDDSAGDQKVSTDRVNVGASTLWSIMPQGRVGADLYGDFQRISELSNLPNEDFALDRDSGRLGARLAWRPGGGLFEWRAGYEFGFNLFERDEFARFDNLQHTINTSGRWRFLPRTALLYDGGYTWIRYPHPDHAPNQGALDRPHDGDVIRTRVGLNGLVTMRLALLAMAGWTASFYDNVPDNQDTFTGQLEAKYFVTPRPTLEATAAQTGLSTVALGYVRDSTNSYLNTFFRRDRIYMNFVYFLGGVLVTSLEGGYSFLSYPRGTAFDEFSQQRIDATLFAEYRVSEIVGINGTVRYDANMSDNLRASPAATMPPATPYEDLDFVRWQAFLGARVFW